MSTSFGENVFAKDVLKRTAAAIPGLWAPRQGDLHARSGSASTKKEGNCNCYGAKDKPEALLRWLR